MKFMVILLFISSSILFAHPTYTGYSGANGSFGTCASSCHGSGTGSIIVTGLPVQYEPLKTYTVIVTHSSGASIVNFNASSRIGSSKNVAGSFAPLSNTSTYSVSAENGIHGSTYYIDTAKFIWTAPGAGTGDISLYVSGLQGSRTGTNTKVVTTISEGTATAVNENKTAPLNFELKQNFPNPFNPSTTIEYSVPSESDVKLTVYNIIGKEVETLVNATQSAGTYNVKFDAGNSANGTSLASGIYFYSIKIGNYTETKKMLLVK